MMEAENPQRLWKIKQNRQAAAIAEKTEATVPSGPSMGGGKAAGGAGRKKKGQGGGGY